MLTGRDIREARDLLGWGRYDLQRRTALPLFAVDRLTNNPGDLDGTLAEDIILREAFHRAGVEFTPDGPRLRQDRG